MTGIVLKQRIVIDESGVNNKIIWPDREFIVEINNECNSEPDMVWLHHVLGEINKLFPIINLSINYSSRLVDCSILSHLSELVNLHVETNKVRSFVGTEELKNLRYVNLSSTKRITRDISALANSSIQSLSIDHVCEKVSKDILKLNNLKFINIFNTKEFNPVWLYGSNVEHIRLINIGVDKLGDFYGIKNLNYLEIACCSKLISLFGDNSNVKQLELESCNSLDLSSINTFQYLIIIEIANCKKELSLNDIAKLQNLKHALLSRCKIAVINAKTIKFNDNMRTLCVNPLGNDDILMLSESNKNIVFTNGEKTFRDGEMISSQEYYFVRDKH